MITALLCAQPPTFPGHLITPVAMDTIQHYNHHISWQLRLYSSYLDWKQAATHSAPGHGAFMMLRYKNQTS